MDQIFNNPVIYFFAKDNNIYFKKYEVTKKICDKLNIDYKNIYFDIYEHNKLKFKDKLNNLLVRNNNFDLLLLNVSDLGNNNTDILNSLSLSYEKNIRVFDLTSRELKNIANHNYTEELKEVV